MHQNWKVSSLRMVFARKVIWQFKCFICIEAKLKGGSDFWHIGSGFPPSTGWLWAAVGPAVVILWMPKCFGGVNMYLGYRSGSLEKNFFRHHFWLSLGSLMFFCWLFSVFFDLKISFSTGKHSCTSTHSQIHSVRSSFIHYFICGSHGAV